MVILGQGFISALVDDPVTIFVEPRSRNENASDVGWTRG